MDANGGTYVPGTRLDTVVPQDIDWIIPGRAAAGFISVLDGDPGLGKSTLLTDWVARLTTGRSILGGTAGTPAGVVLLSGEDHLSSTIQPRMRAAGADLSRVLYLNRVPNVGAFQSLSSDTHPIGIPSDLFYLEAAVTNAEARMVVIDPILLYLDGGVNSNDGGSVRRALDPLQEMAERMRFGVIMVRHLNKSGEGPAIYRGQGSISFGGLARFGMMRGQHPDKDRELVLASYKTNSGPEPRAQVFRIIPAPSDPAIGVVEYGPETTLRANDLTGYVDREEREERSSCRSWVEIVLRYGGVEHKDLMKRAQAAGFGPVVTKSVLSAMGAFREIAGETTRWTLPYVEPATPDVNWDDGSVITTPNGNGRVHV
jgi:putative DNA primase/helicase